jgi:hypothetical protein
VKDDRRRRQAQQKKAREAQANVERSKADETAQMRKLEEAKHDLEHTKYLSDKAERQAEGHLVRIRTGYAEGSKLFFEMFKTQATLTTGSILVIAALSEGLLPENEPYRPLLWFSYVSLLFSMLASLRTMDVVTANVFSTLTGEDRPPPVVPEESQRYRASERAESFNSAAALSMGLLELLRRDWDLRALCHCAPASRSSGYCWSGVGDRYRSPSYRISLR